MAYNPGIEDQRGKFIFAGLQSLGNDIGGALGDVGEGIAKKFKEQQEQEKELAFNDTVIHHALETHRLKPTDDDYLKYLQGNAKQKMGIAHGIIQNIAEDAQQQQQNAMNRLRDAETQQHLQAAILNQARANAAMQAPAGPQTTAIPNPSGGNNLNFYKGPRGWSLIPGQTTQPKPAKSTQTLLEKGMSHYGLTPDDFGKLDFKSMNVEDIGGKPHVTGQTVDGKTIKIPQEKWNEMASIYKNTIAPPAPKTVRVKSKDGKTGSIPADQLESAVAAGYTPIQ